ncbi:MAG: tyrosine--tRNA ligase, partial [Chitinophagaceae bacterium]
AIATTEKLFADLTAPATALSEEDIQTMEGVVRFDYPLEAIYAGADLISFLAETKIFPSKGEARKMIQNGGISINRVKVQDIGQQLSSDNLLHGKYILVQKGKKHYYLVNGI